MRTPVIRHQTEGQITMKLTSRLIPVLLLLALFFTACVKGPEGGGKKVKGSGPVRIGFSMDTLKEERLQRDKDSVEQRCKEVGAECEIQVANSNDSVQAKQGENHLRKDEEVVIVAP